MVKEILFLCGHNAGRSQMAEAMFNHLNNNPDFRAISGGTNIADRINPQAVQAMREIGISMDGQSPKVASPEVIMGAEMVYTMGCNVTCPVPEKITADWNLDDPAGASIEKVREVRDQIRARVLALLKELNRPKLRTVSR